MAASSSTDTAPENQRFASFSNEELRVLIDQVDAQNTKDVIAYALRTLRSYGTEKGVDFASLDTVTPGMLSDFLRSSYAEERSP